MNGKIYVYFNKRKYEQEKIKKYYIGQTSRTIEQRAGSQGSGYHKYDNNKNSKFANAIRKWGWDSFEVTVLEENITSQVKLNELEVYYIEKFDSYNNGYNSTLGGDGVTGCKHTGMYGKVFTDEHRKKLSLSHIGKPSVRKGSTHTEEAKAKIRQARKKQVGQNHPMYGKHHSEEIKRKISESSKKMWQNEEYKNKYIKILQENRHNFKKGGIPWNKGLKGKPAYNRKKVICIETGEIFNSISEAEKIKKTNNISCCCNGKRKSTNGLHWRYYEE